MNITRRDIVDSIKDEFDKKNIEIEPEDIKEILELFFDDIVDALKNGNSVELRNFGVFKSYIRQGRRGHNPKTKVKVDVPAKRIVKFLPGRKMKEEIKKYDHLYVQK